MVANLAPEVLQLYSQFPTSNRSANFPTLERACEETAPSLVDIDNLHGSNTSIIWIVVQLISTIKFTGQNFSVYQLENTAQQLRKLGYHVTMAEMAIFFDRFEQGYYGTFQGYSHPNPQVITKAFQRFISDLIEIRSQIWSRVEAEQERREREEAKNKAVPPPPEIKERLENFIKNFGKYERTESNTQETSVQAPAENQADSSAER